MRTNDQQTKHGLNNCAAQRNNIILIRIMHPLCSNTVHVLCSAWHPLCLFRWLSHSLSLSLSVYFFSPSNVNENNCIALALNNNNIIAIRTNNDNNNIPLASNRVHFLYVCTANMLMVRVMQSLVMTDVSWKMFVNICNYATMRVYVRLQCPSTCVHIFHRMHSITYRHQAIFFSSIKHIIIHVRFIYICIICIYSFYLFVMHEHEPY